jgi:integrase
MASLYKKPVMVTDPDTGERVKTKSKKWWGRFKNENGVERRVPLAADKTAAQAMLNDLVKQVERRKAGIVDAFDDQRKRPIREQLEDFKKHLRSKEVSPEQIKLVIYRAGQILDGCKVKTICDLSASQVQLFLADLRDSGKSIQTSNHYLRAIKQFTRWLLKDQRIISDPIAFLSMLNVSTDRRHDRRPFSEAELQALLHAAKTGSTRLKMPGECRAMLYATAAYTGLRASELASLTRESFHLDGQPPTVTVQAAYSKHRRQDVLPLHPSLVAMLRPWLATKALREPVWPGNWAKLKYAGRMLKRDLKTAGIPYVDENGLYADFHALRHTFITNMVKAGVNPKTAQSLARHSSIDLTMNVYTSLTVNDQASALESLPAVPNLDGKDGQKKVPTMVPRGAEIGAKLLTSDAPKTAPDCTVEARKKDAKTPKKLGESGVIPRQNKRTDGRDRKRLNRFHRPGAVTENRFAAQVFFTCAGTESRQPHPFTTLSAHTISASHPTGSGRRSGHRALCHPSGPASSRGYHRVSDDRSRDRILLPFWRILIFPVDWLTTTAMAFVCAVMEAAA